MKHPRIMVVNDDTTFLNLMQALLQDEGYDVSLLIEGSLAYSRIREARPDLVILDIRMEHPETGWEVLNLLRLDPETADLPVIVCSADSQFLREKAVHLREKNCDVLEKPFDLPDLLSKVEAVVGSPPGRGCPAQG